MQRLVKKLHGPQVYDVKYKNCSLSKLPKIFIVLKILWKSNYWVKEYSKWHMLKQYIVKVFKEIQKETEANVAGTLRNIVRFHS